MSGGSKPRKIKSNSPPSSATTAADKPLTLAARMARRSLLKLFLAAALLLFALYALSPAPSPRLDSYHPSSSSSLIRPDPSDAVPRPAPPAPKVYVYDLPRKFTYGVIRSYLLARGPLRSHSPADADLKYPGHQHSAEWHLLSDLNRPDRAGYPLARTSDPDEADLFFVPFFSSLSLIVNPIRPAGDAGGSTAPAYSDEDMQEELVEWLEGQEYWKRNNGRDHVFICQDPNALYKVIDRVRNGVLLVSDFGRLRADQASLVKDVILPYSHRINSYKGEVGVQGRSSLLFFMGNRYRKEGGKIRDTLFQILEDEKDVVIKHGAQSRESRRMATQGMHSSRFCLHPAGDTPSACRLFDAIVSLCIPVIVSDYIELPFEDVIDYKKIAIFIDTNTAVKPQYLTLMLRGVSTERILQYQRELHAVKHYFEYDDPNGTVNEIWRQVSLKVPLIKLMINRDNRLLRVGSDGPECSCVCSSKNGTKTAR